MSSTKTQLSEQQLNSLFHILVHHETYAEVESFKYPAAIRGYGYPFTEHASADEAVQDGSLSKTPMLQLLLTNFVLSAPGFRDLSPEFWGTKFKGIMERFAEARLSESYDKGTLGTRKRLACAATVVHEAVTRGLLAGIPKDEKKVDLQQEYDLDSADGITKAYEDALTALIHHDLATELFDHLATSSDFEAHSPAVRGGMDYAIIHVATLLHYIFVLSAEGPYLVKQVENIHGLVPYNLIRQTLRVGNAATMINGMARLFLAKLSIGSVTNWFGLTKDASDGMNLMQRIISMVLTWNANDCRKAADRFRKADGHVDHAFLDAIDKHVQASGEQQDAVRLKSQREDKSIIVAILESADLTVPKDFSTEHHNQCLGYYATKMGVWDREESIKVICEQSPDFVTGMVRDIIKAFEPMIRNIHDNVDLKKLVTAVENILNDAIAVGKCQSPENGCNKKTTGKERATVGKKATVDDYVALLHRHKQPLMFEYLHSVAKSCTEIREMWHGWISGIVKIFREDYDPRSAKSKSGQAQTNKANTKAQEPVAKQEKPARPSSEGGAGRLSKELQDLFDQAPADKQEDILSAIDEYTDYLAELGEISNTRMQRIIDGKRPPSPPTASGSGPATADGRGNMTGPGVYLSMFEHLLNSTPITPETPWGPMRRGKDVKSELGHGKVEAITAAAAAAAAASNTTLPTQPSQGTASASTSAGGTPSVRSVSTTSSSRPTRQGGGAGSLELLGSSGASNDTSSIVSDLGLEPPDVQIVFDTLGDDFRTLVAETSLRGMSA